MIDKLLKLASEDPQNQEKLAFINEALDQSFEFKAELIKEHQDYLESTDEKLEQFSKEASFKDIAGKAKAGASRFGELLSGGQRMAMPSGSSPSTVLNVERPGNSFQGLKHDFTRSEALKSHAARLGTGAAAVGAGVGAHHLLSEEKTANAGGFWSRAGEKALQGAGMAGVGIAGIVGTALVNDLYSSTRNALTKSRNFNRMIEADPSLREYPAEKVKAYFNTIHEKGGPEISGDPLIASSFVKQQLEFHGQNIIDQVNKVVGIRSSVEKNRQIGRLDFGELLKTHKGAPAPEEKWTRPTFEGHSGPRNQDPYVNNSDPTRDNYL